MSASRTRILRLGAILLPRLPRKKAQPAQIVRVAHNSVGAKWEGQMDSPGWVDPGHGRRHRGWIVGLAIGPVVVYSGTQRVNSKTLVPSSSRTANARMALSPVHSVSLEPAGRTVSWTAGHAARVGLHSDSSGPRRQEVWASCPPITGAGSLRQDTVSNGSHPPRWDAKAGLERGWLLDVGEGVWEGSSLVWRWSSQPFTPIHAMLLSCGE